MNTKELNTPEINHKVHELYSQWNTDINTRIKKYIAEKEPGLSFSEVKNYFMQQADPHNMLPPYQQYDNYFKEVNTFLEEQGY